MGTITSFFIVRYLGIVGKYFYKLSAIVVRVSAFFSGLILLIVTDYSPNNILQAISLILSSMPDYLSNMFNKILSYSYNKIFTQQIEVPKIPVINNTQKVKEIIEDKSIANTNKDSFFSLRNWYKEQEIPNVHGFWDDYKYYVYGACGVVAISIACYYYSDLAVFFSALLFGRDNDDGPDGGSSVILSNQKRSSNPEEIMNDIKIADNRSDTTEVPGTPKASGSTFELPKSGFESEAEAQGLSGVFVKPADDAHREQLIKERDEQLSEIARNINKVNLGMLNKGKEK